MIEHLEPAGAARRMSAARKAEAAQFMPSSMPEGCRHESGGVGFTARGVIDSTTESLDDSIRSVTVGLEDASRNTPRLDAEADVIVRVTGVGKRPPTGNTPKYFVVSAVTRVGTSEVLLSEEAARSSFRLRSAVQP